MRVEEIRYHDGLLTVRCTGVFGIGSEGHPSTDLIRQSVNDWMTENVDHIVDRIELDLADVAYEWGDGPISSMMPFLKKGVGSVRLVASPANRSALQSLVAQSGFAMFSVDER